MQPNGTYQVEFVFRDRGVTSRVSEQGRWQVQGPSIAFESEADFSLVPFQLRGESLMLDYRDQAGLVAILSRTPGQGQIHSVDSGDDD
jgi:hypothetical protein